MTDTQLKILVDELRTLPKESEWVEFKGNNAKPDEIGEYISALSNSACLYDKEFAYLIFGIEDQTHRVIGTTFTPKNRRVGNNELENWLATLLEPRIDFSIFEFEYSANKHIVIFRIDPTLSMPVRFKGTEYIRVGSNKKKLAAHSEKARKIWSKTAQQPFESELAVREISSDDVLKLLDYPGYFSLTNQNLPSNKDAILGKLEEEKLIVKDSGGYDITNLGAILFAKDLSKFQHLMRKAVRVIIYKGKNRLQTIKEQEGGKGYAVGFEGLIDYIIDQLPTNEEIGRAFRKEMKMYPEIAIRELVANALIHQDLQETGTGPMVEIFSDRIEISNPGKPLINTLRFIDHNPQSRNEKLAYFMRRINICEERGSGIDKVVSSMEMFQLPAPNFIEEENFLKIILSAPKTLRQMDKNDKNRACYQHACLKFVSNKHMTNQSLRKRFNIDEKNYSIVSRIISDTMNEGLIKDYDPGSKSRKYAKYIPFWA